MSAFGLLAGGEGIVLYCRFRHHRSRIRMDANTTVKIVAGVLCLILVAVIILRKKGKKKANEEEF